MFRAVDRTNLTVHSLESVGPREREPGNQGQLDAAGRRDYGSPSMSATSDNLKRQGNLQVLPDRTGGRAVMNTNGPISLVPEIFRESDSYYLIGFVPAIRARTGNSIGSP